MLEIEFVFFLNTEVVLAMRKCPRRNVPWGRCYTGVEVLTARHQLASGSRGTDADSLMPQWQSAWYGSGCKLMHSASRITQSPQRMWSARRTHIWCVQYSPHLAIPDMTYNVFSGTLSLTQSISPHLVSAPNVRYKATDVSVTFHFGNVM